MVNEPRLTATVALVLLTRTSAAVAKWIRGPRREHIVFARG